MIRNALGALALVTASAAIAQSGVSIVNAGSEQALRVGDTTYTRPFGAQLVDRLSVAGNYRVGGAQLYLIRGDGGPECPARYVILAQRPGHHVAITDPFGTCSTIAHGKVDRHGLVISMPATADGGPSVRFAYEDGRMELFDAQPATSVSGGPNDLLGMGDRAAQSCRPAAETDPATRASVLADFERNYPQQYRSTGALNHAEIAPAELHVLVASLACLSTWPGADRVVPETALPLFRSHRYGHAAFAAIEAVGRDPATDVNLAAALKTFGSDMRYRIDSRDVF